jgi:hypothetical protein
MREIAAKPNVTRTHSARNDLSSELVVIAFIQINIKTLKPENNPGGRCSKKSCKRRTVIIIGTGTKFGSLSDQQNITSSRIFGQGQR